jgi:hypothetical protein
VKSRHLLIAALVGAIMLVGALPAFAGSLGATVNYDGDPAGDGTLRHNGGGSYTLIACDVQKDGFGITAYAWSDRVGVPVSASDTNGASKRTSGTKGCATKHIGLTGNRVYLKVCRRDRNGDVDKSGRETCSAIRTTSN